MIIKIATKKKFFWPLVNPALTYYYLLSWYGKPGRLCLCPCPCVGWFQKELYKKYSMDIYKASMEDGSQLTIDLINFWCRLPFTSFFWSPPTPEGKYLTLLTVFILQLKMPLWEELQPDGKAKEPNLNVKLHKAGGSCRFSDNSLQAQHFSHCHIGFTLSCDTSS